MDRLHSRFLRANKLFGDDIALRAASYDVDLAGVSQVGFLLRHAAAGKSVIKRVSTAATLLASSGTKVEQALVAHCEVTGHLATRLGLGGQVAEALGYAFARWDGKGLPAGVGKPTFRCLLGFSIWPMSSSPTSAWAGWIGL